MTFVGLGFILLGLLGLLLTGASARRVQRQVSAKAARAAAIEAQYLALLRRHYDAAAAANKAARYLQRLN